MSMSMSRAGQIGRAMVVVVGSRGGHERAPKTGARARHASHVGGHGRVHGSVHAQIGREGGERLVHWSQQVTH